MGAAVPGAAGAAHGGVGAAGGVGGGFSQLQLQQLKSLVQDLLQPIQNSVAELGQRVTELGQRVTLLEIGLDNERSRCQNLEASNAPERHSTAPLAPLRNTGQGQGQLGEVPGFFPATLDVLSILSGAQLNALAEFYGLQLAGNRVSARRDSFRAFITRR